MTLTMDWWHAASLLAQTLDVMRWAWPFGALLAAVALGSTGFVAARQRSLPPQRWAWALLLILNPVLMVALAGLCSCRNCAPGSMDRRAAYAAAALLALQLLIACWSTWRAGTWRLCVGALHALLLWPAACTALIIGTMF